MASEKQIAANRANARRSTGPRTPAGKARASRNALRHGLLAKTFVLADESSDTFRAFVQGFHDEFNPATSSEIALVDQMATARWRLIRTAGMETASLDYEASRLTGPVPSHAVRAVLAHREALRASPSLELLGRTEARLQRQFDGAFTRLRTIRAERRDAEQALNTTKDTDPYRLCPPNIDSNPNSGDPEYR